MNLEKKEFLLNVFLGIVSFLIDFFKEIIEAVLVLPKFIFIFTVGYLIYRPEELLGVDSSFLVGLFSFVNSNISFFVLLFLSLAFISLFMNYCVGRKKFVLGEILNSFFSKKNPIDNSNLKGE